MSCHQSREYLAGRNSRVTIGVSKSLFDSVDYNGTMFVDDEKDDDWVRSCSVLFDTFLFVKIGLVWGMLDINNFYILISNRQQNNKACKTTVTTDDASTARKSIYRTDTKLFSFYIYIYLQIMTCNIFFA